MKNNKFFSNEIFNVEIDSKTKGVLELNKIKIKDIPKKKWNILNQDIQFPILTINELKFNKNISSMKKYAESNNVSLAPHCKTSMSPQLLNRIKELGCWGFTVANNQQLSVLLQMGVKKVILANLITNESNLLNLFNLVKKYNKVSEIFICVDSAYGVNLLKKISLKYEFNSKLKILFEVGLKNSRSGIRNIDSLRSLVKSFKKLPNNFILSGILFYEGASKTNNYLFSIRNIKKSINLAIKCFDFLIDNKLIKNNEYILSGGGSEFFDLVVDSFKNYKKTNKVKFVIRPGSYIAFGNGYYANALKKIDKRKKIFIKKKSKKASDLFFPSLELWAFVISQQDKGRAILNFGKRDVSFDLGYPIPLSIYRNKKLVKNITTDDNINIYKLNDQHAFIKFNKFNLSVGDLIKFGVSHPCVTIDNWNTLYMINNRNNITEALKTFF